MIKKFFSNYIVAESLASPTFKAVALFPLSFASCLSEMLLVRAAALPQKKGEGRGRIVLRTGEN